MDLSNQDILDSAASEQLQIRGRLMASKLRSNRPQLSSTRAMPGRLDYSRFDHIGDSESEDARRGVYRGSRICGSG